MSEDDFAALAFALGTFVCGSISGLSFLRDGISPGVYIFGATAVFLLLGTVCLYVSNRRKSRQFK